jgi:hypothetical protein
LVAKSRRYNDLATTTSPQALRDRYRLSRRECGASRCWLWLFGVTAPRSAAYIEASMRNLIESPSVTGLAGTLAINRR